MKQKGELFYVQGDATDPKGIGLKLIIHCCNDIGAWGAGFVLALNRRWEAPELNYRAWCKGITSVGTTGDAKLGECQFVEVRPDTTVVNMIGQHDVREYKGVPAIRYPAIETCLQKVAVYAILNEGSVHCPKFGAGLAGGDWKMIEALLVKCLVEKGINVTVYCL